ncbi:MAG: pilus assembly protein [Acidobacteria bacterium]|nr:pilus assembly protein [Acidobacteriota bacterium]
MKRDRGRAKQEHKQRGTQVAELAMVLPLLLFLGLAVTEGAGFVRAHQMLNNAAREGAKFSSLQRLTDPPPLVVIEAVVDDYLKNATSNGGTPPVYGMCANSGSGCTAPFAVVTVNQCATVTTASGVNTYASQVDVSFAYQLQYLPRLPWFSFPATVNLRGRAEFANFFGC